MIFEPITHNLPIDQECHPKVTERAHVGSCLAAKYAKAAIKQNKYWEVHNVLFQMRVLDDQHITEALKQVRGLNVTKLKRDAHSEEIKDSLLDEINKAENEGIIATPTLKLNFHVQTGYRPYKELKQKLIDMGAIERNPGMSIDDEETEGEGNSDTPQKSSLKDKIKKIFNELAKKSTKNYPEAPDGEQDIDNLGEAE